MSTPKKTARKAAPRKTSAPKPTQRASAPRQQGIGCSWKAILIVVGVLGFLTLGALNSRGDDRKAQDSQLAAQASGAELGQAGQQPTATTKPTSTPRPTKTPRPTNPPADTAAPAQWLIDTGQTHYNFA